MLMPQQKFTNIVFKAIQTETEMRQREGWHPLHEIDKTCLLEHACAVDHYAINLKLLLQDAEKRLQNALVALDYKNIKERAAAPDAPILAANAFLDISKGIGDTAQKFSTYAHRYEMARKEMESSWPWILSDKTVAWLKEQVKSLQEEALEGA